MRDLAEIRRFWPRAVRSWDGYIYSFHPLKDARLALVNRPAGVWCLADKRGAKVWTRHERSTIAAAMAAAGFAARKVGKWRSLRLFLEAENRHPWNPDDWKPYKTPLQSRQRPRKGARLGKRGRWLQAYAASCGGAGLWRLPRKWQKRLDRGEIEG